MRYCESLVIGYTALRLIVEYYNKNTQMLSLATKRYVHNLVSLLIRLISHVLQQPCVQEQEGFTQWCVQKNPPISS